MMPQWLEANAELAATLSWGNMEGGTERTAPKVA